MNDAASCNMEVREVGMAPAGLDDDRSFRPYGAAGELGFRELETLTQGHLGVMRIPRHRIANGFRRHVEDARHPDVTIAGLEVHGEINRLNNGSCTVSHIDTNT